MSNYNQTPKVGDRVKILTYYDSIGIKKTEFKNKVGTVHHIDSNKKFVLLVESEETLGIDADCGDKWQVLTNNNYSTMRKLTSALKRLLNQSQQTLYQVGYIDEGLELSPQGQEKYVKYLYQESGDHKKAVEMMTKEASEKLQEE